MLLKKETFDLLLFNAIKPKKNNEEKQEVDM